MTFLECVPAASVRLRFSSAFPTLSRSCDARTFWHIASLRSPLPPPIVQPASAGSLAA
jgi:hypothetical protein